MSRPSSLHRHVVAIVASGTLSWLHGPVEAWAHTGPSREPSLETLPAGPLKQAIEELDALLGKHGLDASLVAGPRQQAVRAAERERGAQVSGDTAHARMLRKLGQEWVGVGEAVVRATRAEASAQAQADEAKVVGEQVERAHALLAEQQARRGRLQAEVDNAEKAAAESGAALRAVEQARLDKAERRGRRTGGGGTHARRR